MQHDRVLIKLNFDFLTPTQGSGVGAICRQNICDHVVVVVVVDIISPNVGTPRLRVEQFGV